MTEAAVTALIVTFRRNQQLIETLSGVVAQTHKPDLVVVVDNAADENLARRIAQLHPEVTYVASPENVGPGGGFGLGLRRAHEERPDAEWFWLLDDDSPPARDALAQALATAESTSSSDEIGAIGLRGGHIRRGRIRHDLPVGTVHAPTTADFLLVDGSILSAAAVRRAGYPRADFFIMMEDLEYSLRIGEAGFTLLVRPDDGSTNLYQGSGAAWRGYYQSRNHLRLAIERRSVVWILGWMRREVGINAHHLRARRWSAIRARLHGAVDATRNRMGRTVEPTNS
jgi:rhamnopyranosyl-N-acetylglucosaminyl-diphospho-decaprenol beta-1,3/1,4-galactofuranosyltransferase